MDYNVNVHWNVHSTSIVWPLGTTVARDPIAEAEVSLRQWHSPDVLSAPPPDRPSPRVTIVCPEGLFVACWSGVGSQRVRIRQASARAHAHGRATPGFHASPHAHAHGRAAPHGRASSHANGYGHADPDGYASSHANGYPDPHGTASSYANGYGHADPCGTASPYANAIRDVYPTADNP